VSGLMLGEIKAWECGSSLCFPPQQVLCCLDAGRCPPLRCGTR